MTDDPATFLLRLDALSLDNMRASLANMLDRTVTVAGAAAYLGVSRSRIVQLADNYDRGRAGLPSVRTPGGHRLFLLADLEHRHAATTTRYPLSEHDAILINKYAPREDTTT